MPSYGEPFISLGTPPESRYPTPRVLTGFIISNPEALFAQDAAEFLKRVGKAVMVSVRQNDAPFAHGTQTAQAVGKRKQKPVRAPLAQKTNFFTPANRLHSPL